MSKTVTNLKVVRTKRGCGNPKASTKHATESLGHVQETIVSELNAMRVGRRQIMSVEEGSVIDEPLFRRIATVAVDMIRSVVNGGPKARLSEEELSERSGVTLPVLKSLIRQKEFERTIGELTGAQWERLLSSAGIYVEDVIERAKVERIPTEGGWRYMAGVHAGKPSPDMDQKIQDVLDVMGEFFLFATRKYLQKHV